MMHSLFAGPTGATEMTNMGLFTQGNEGNNPLMNNQNGIYGPGPHAHGHPPGQPGPGQPGHFGQGPPPNNQGPYPSPYGASNGYPNNGGGGQNPASNPFGAVLVGGAQRD